MSRSGASLSVSVGQLSSREFVMTGANYKVVQGLAYELTGISLSSHKENMIYGRLARRLRALNLKSFDEYCQLISQKDSSEHLDFVNAITTNLTAFFREMHHFEYLKNTLLPELVKKNAKSRRIRIWSAGCSTGEEAYSIAMVVKSCDFLRGWDVKILATDLDTSVVAKAKSGEYSLERGDPVPNEYLKFIERRGDSDFIRMKSSLTDIITFNQLNLLKSWPMKAPFDLIFCRNVVIYFDSETQRILFNRYADTLHSGGYLFIGHSENLSKVCNRFEGLGKTMHRRIQ